MPPINQRRQDRTKAVFPVKVKGKDVAGKSFEDMAHTLDITPTGVKLGSVRRELKIHDPITLWYRNRKMEFRVAWIQKLKGVSEYHIGLQALAQEKDIWGLNPADFKMNDVPLASPAPAEMLAAAPAPA